MMSPQIASTKPAPAKRRVLSTWSVKPDGRPPFRGSSEKEYGVLAMLMGRLPKPCFSYRASLCSASFEKDTPPAP